MRVVVKASMFLSIAMGMPGFQAFADSSDFDGKWEFENSCSAATGVRKVVPFALKLPATIENGSFSIASTSLTRGDKVRDGIRGTVKDSELSIFMDGKDANGGKWHETLNGQAISPAEMVFDGTHFDWIKDKWVLTRTCSGKLRALEPPSTPLAASNPVISASLPSSLPNPAPSPGPVPTASRGATFDGTYSGSVTLSGMPSCEKTMSRNFPIEVKNDHFDATVFNVKLSVDVPANGVFSVSGVRHTDNARADVSGKINGRTMELAMQNPYCKAHAILTAANISSSPPPGDSSVPAASPRPRRLSGSRHR